MGPSGWQVYFTKDEASIREDQAKAEAERARKAKQDRLPWPSVEGFMNGTDQWSFDIFDVWF